MTYAKTNVFTQRQQEMAKLAKVLSHPARIAVLEYLAEKNVCISGDITNEIPLSRSTVSQHLQELKNAGLIKGEIFGTRVNYCICGEKMNEVKEMLSYFIKLINSPMQNGC